MAVQEKVSVVDIYLDRAPFKIGIEMLLHKYVFAYA